MLSVNYETGLCVLFSTSADTTPGALSPSQFPVFTLYAQKICVRASRSRCSRSWIFDRVSGFKLEGFTKRSRQYRSREDCMASCLAASTFTCRSINYNVNTGDCYLSELDRNSISNPSDSFKISQDFDYMESNCASDPVSQCQFRPMRGQILKTVDSVYQNVNNLEECRELCINADYRCHSFDYGDTGSQVCRLSHHSTSTLMQIEEPYLDAVGATTYELGACYNVTVECKSSFMVAKVRTNRVFDGRMYGKSRPNSCTVDVRSSLDFELYLGFNDINCDVRQEIPGKYASDVIIQHHDMIVTSNDVGLEVKCNYNLSNKSISHNADLEVDGDLPGEANAEQTIVQAPNVTMRITDRLGKDIQSAKVGDRLALRFEIQDRNKSPYEIFVRELIASDGIDASEILLIDAIGCPTDYSIMNVLEEVNGSGQTLHANFEAFKFPTSSVVQFRALVTPCIPRCDPVVCEITDYHGSSKSLTSFGKRKKRSSEHDFNHIVDAAVGDDTKKEDVMVAGVIHISDQFELNQESPFEEDHEEENEKSTTTDWNNTNKPEVGKCQEDDSSFFSAVLCAILFLGVQSILLAGWISFYFKHKNLKDSNDFNQNNRGHEPYRDFDPYLSTIFRSKKESPISSPEPSLDLVQRKLILTHLDDKKQRRRS